MAQHSRKGHSRQDDEALKTRMPIGWHHLCRGQFVWFMHDDEWFQGKVLDVHNPKKVVIMAGVISLTTCIRKSGRQRYCQHDIHSLEEVDEATALAILATEDRPISMRQRSRNMHLDNLQQLDMPNLLAQKQLKLECDLVMLDLEEGSPRRLPAVVQDSWHHENENFRDRLAIEFCATRDVCWHDQETPPQLEQIPQLAYFVHSLDESNEAYRIAKERLETARVIGLALEGRNLGRSGHLSLVSMSLPDAVFVFDYVMASAVLDSPDGLIRKLLVSPHVVKVVHDCRRMSDLLEHKFHLRIENLYDTLAAFLAFAPWGIYSGYMPYYAVTYNTLVRQYLGVASKCLFFPHFRRTHYEKDTSIWMKRPLEPEMFTAAALNARYLLDLRRLTRLCLNAPLYRATNALLASHRDADEIQVKRLQTELLALVPDEVADVLPRWKPRPYSARKMGPIEEDKKLVYNATQQLDPLVVFSRDCLHQNREFPQW